MYAILKELREAVRAQDETEEAQRCLILSDCASVLQRVEGAWRAGQVGRYGRNVDQGGMLEEICVLRHTLQMGGGRVVITV